MRDFRIHMLKHYRNQRKGQASGLRLSHIFGNLVPTCDLLTFVKTSRRSWGPESQMQKFVRLKQTVPDVLNRIDNYNHLPPPQWYTPLFVKVGQQVLHLMSVQSLPTLPFLDQIFVFIWYQ